LSKEVCKNSGKNSLREAEGQKEIAPETESSGAKENLRPSKKLTASLCAADNYVMVGARERNTGQL
jgi:hypothetical protein